MKNRPSPSHLVHFIRSSISPPKLKSISCELVNKWSPWYVIYKNNIKITDELLSWWPSQEGLVETSGYNVDYAVYYTSREGDRWHMLSLIFSGSNQIRATFLVTCILPYLLCAAEQGLNRRYIFVGFDLYFGMQLRWSRVKVFPCRCTLSDEPVYGGMCHSGGIPLSHVVRYVRDLKCFDNEIIQVNVGNVFRFFLSYSFKYKWCIQGENCYRKSVLFGSWHSILRKLRHFPTHIWKVCEDWMQIDPSFPNFHSLGLNAGENGTNRYSVIDLRAQDSFSSFFSSL